LAEIISSDVALLVTFNQAIAYLRFTAAVGNQASENLSPDVPLVFRKCTRARRLCTAARSCLKAFWCLGGPICRVSSLWRMEGNYSFANQSGRPEIFVKAIQFHPKGSLLQNCRGAERRLRD
jgi:hypothetical protein